MFRKPIIVVVVPLVVLLIVILSCGRGATIVTRHHGMDLIPGDVLGGMYWDYKSMREDRDLSAEYDSMAGEQQEEGFEDMGVSLSQIDFIVTSDIGGVMGGRFDQANVRTALEELDFEEGTYEDVELWTGYYDEFGNFAVAILKGGLIFGEPNGVKAHVRVINGTEVSLYQTEDYRRVMNRLPGWNPIRVWTVMDDPSVLLGIPDVLTLVIVYGKADKDNLKLAIAIEFESESAAIEGMAAVNTFMEPMGGTEIEVDRSGTFVTIEAKAPIQILLP